MKIRSVAAICFAFFLAVGAAACGDSGDTGDDRTGGSTGADSNGSDPGSSSGGAAANAGDSWTGTGSGDATSAAEGDAGSNSDDSSPEPGTGDDAGGTTTGPVTGADGGSNESNGDAGGSTNADQDAGPLVVDDGGGQVVEPVDPCDPNPCTVPFAGMCNEAGEVVTYSSDGTCTVIDDEFTCDYPSETAACEGDQFCVGGGCVAPGDPTEYVFDENASIVTKLGLAEDDPTTPDVDEGDCCFDYNGDGEPDNGLGGLLASLGSFLGDSLPEDGVNGLIAEEIESGGIAILFEQIGLDDAANDDQVTLNGFFGAMDDGAESYSVDPSSFIEGTDTPYISFDNGAIVEGELTAGPALFSVTIPLGEFGFDIKLDAQQAQIWSNVALSDGGSGLDWTDGILGGVVPMSQLMDALNNLGTSCDCLGLGGEPMLELKAEDKLGCTPALSGATPACSDDPDGSLCVGIADNKGLVCTAIGIIKPDIDTDLSGKKDSFSLGLRFEAVAASISGLQAAEGDTSGTDD